MYNVHCVFTQWDGNRDDLAANCGKELRILTTQSMQAHYGHDVSAVQVGSSQLLVECHSSGLLHSITTDVHIRGTWVTKVYTSLTMYVPCSIRTLHL